MQYLAVRFFPPAESTLFKIPQCACPPEIRTQLLEKYYIWPSWVFHHGGYYVAFLVRVYFLCANGMASST